MTQSNPQDQNGAPWERLFSLLSEISTSLKTIADCAAKNRGASQSNLQPKPKPISGERFWIDITGFAARWRSGTGAFYRGTITVDNVEYPCSLGVKDALNVELRDGDTVIVAGALERKQYNGADTMSIFANSIEVCEPSNSTADSSVDSQIEVGGNDTEDIPF